MTDKQIGEGERAAFEADRLEQIIDAYIEDYEMIGETEDGRDACYSATDGEKAIIKDAIMGLLASDEWDAEWGRLIAARASLPRPSGPTETLVSALKEKIGVYWTLAHAEGKEGREHDTEDGAAQRTWHEIGELIGALAAPQPPAAPTEPLRKALEQIAKPGYGLELGDSDDARADYWHGQTEMCRRIARAALAASAEQPKPEGALEALRSWADTHRLSDVSSDWDAGYEAARAFVKTQFDVVGQPKPLSDEEIDAVVEQFYMKLKGWDYGGTQVIEVNGYTEYGFARAIERAVLSRIQGSEK
jgi:hypothetical protein